MGSPKVWINFRRGVALIWLLLFLLLFLTGIKFLPPVVGHLLTSLQFTPQLVKLLNGVLSAAVILLAIVAVTLVFGRVYCSLICPLGQLQDLISRISSLFKKKKNRKQRYSKPLNWLRYSILTLSILPLSVAFWGYFDPYSIFGRIVSQLLRPLLIGLKNLIASLLSGMGYYGIAPETMGNFSHITFWGTLIFALVITILAASRGRLFCNTFCPIGTILGTVSRYALFKIRLNPDNCIGCNKCATQCKADCIDPAHGIVDHSRCVMCLNCLDVCPVNQGISFSAAPKKKSPVDSGRRKIIGSALLALSALPLFAQTSRADKTGPGTAVKTGRKHPLIPPGAVSIKHYTSLCTSCHLCISSCPTHVLQPSLFNFGVEGLFMPHFDPHTSFCNFECTICGEVCPTGAILPLTVEDKMQTSIGKAHFEKLNCVVFVNGENCGACAEHCPVKAVRMVDYGSDGLRIPEVNQALCIGCGACEYICPSRPNRAIFVEALQVHELADKPIKVENTFEIEEEFPF